MYTSCQHMHEQLIMKRGERRGATSLNREQEVTSKKKVISLDKIGDKRETNRKKES